MTMELRCCPTITVVQLLDLDLIGGITQSIFPEVEAYLKVDHDHLKALQWIARNKSADRYKSVMDWLFCETYRQWRGACRKFYERDDENEGPMLKDLITEPERKLCAWGMLQMVKAAYEAFCAERWMSWGHLREQVLAEAA
jgi:hypothetical protein